MTTDTIFVGWPLVVEWFVVRAQSYWLGANGIRNYAIVALVLAIALAIEVASRSDWRSRYRTKQFGIDLAYYGFYYSGLYQLLVLSWIYKGITYLMATHAPGLQLRLLSDLPPWLQFLALYLLVDLLQYWHHRWRHSNRILWAFHAVHHSQTRLTVMSNYRFHVLDETFVRLFMFIPFQIVLGAPVEVWLWVDFIIMWVLLMQHSNWNWTYGPLGRVVVSPAFHRIHHATADKYLNRNFGGTFSFWDDLFGTAERGTSENLTIGLPGNPIRESLWAHFAYPFQQLGRELRPPRGVRPVNQPEK